MKEMNFYTSNGWAGKNYDGQSTKEIAKEVRGYARKRFQGFKFSIRYEWGMNADTIYIELKGGPCTPFVAESRCAVRGYLSTGNSVEPFKPDLTPEVFNALDGVVRYANSYRYNDSDAMTDYFDTNFYVCIKIGDNYKVIKPKPGKGIDTKKGNEAVAVASVPVSAGFEVVDYSEKAVAVFGDTKAVKERLKELGGRFNTSLNHNGYKRAGWVFPKKRADELRALLAPSKADDAQLVDTPDTEGLPAVPETAALPEPSNVEDVTESGVLDVEAVRPAKVFRRPGVVAYEKTCRQGGRYEAKYKCGGWWVVDLLDNSAELCMSREEAESEAARWNGMTDENGRLKKVI